MKKQDNMFPQREKAHHIFKVKAEPSKSIIKIGQVGVIWVL